jgi:hypothetical protein
MRELTTFYCLSVNHRFNVKNADEKKNIYLFYSQNNEKQRK